MWDTSMPSQVGLFEWLFGAAAATILIFVVIYLAGLALVGLAYLWEGLTGDEDPE